jgi:hypothetical protein
MINLTADVLLRCQQPPAGARYVPEEILYVSMLCCSFDLHACQCLTDDNRNAFRSCRWVIKYPLKSRDCVLRLDQHIAHIDESEVLIAHTPKVSMRCIARGFKVVNFPLREKATDMDRDEIQSRCGVDRKMRSHFATVKCPGYQRVARRHRRHNRIKIHSVTNED